MRAALYARYSTELQRQESIVDQHRVCERLAERHGFTVVARYADEAISGGTAQRPQYQAMLTAARTGQFDVIVAEDTSRLWRNLAEQSPRLAELSDIGVAIVTHDLDTRQESAGIMGAVGGAMAEQFRKEIGRRTRRGLEGLARNATPTGGKAYGYVAARDGNTGNVEVHEGEADIVRRIFAGYAAGVSPKSIAAQLNRDGVASPGSSWKRARGSRGWMSSAIASSTSRGLGILNNETYIGRIAWNRVRWVRSAADSSRRRCIENPRKEWILRQDERLRIVSDSLWQAVKSRQRDRQHRIGERVSQGIKASRAARTGRPPGYLFSGLLRCASCGANLVIANKTSYACASRINGGGCSNDAYVRRVEIEVGLLRGIQEKLREQHVVEEARRRILAALRQADKTASPSPARIAQLEREVAALVDAVASGALRSSQALAQRLVAAESELEKLKSPRPDSIRPTVEALVPGIVDTYLRAVDALADTLARTDVDRAREELRQRIGVIEVEVDAQQVRFRTEAGAIESALQRLAGSQQISVVAGVGFEPTTFGL